MKVSEGSDARYALARILGSWVAAAVLVAVLETYGTASNYNHDLVSSLGATPIDYRTEDFVERIHATCDGVDAVLVPSAAQGTSGVHTGHCAKAGGTWAMAW